MTDSRLSSGVSTHSARGVPGGKIIAQNPALLQMLREKTLERENNSNKQKDKDEPVRRLYVESPVFTREDEENIKFVSTDVEDDLRDSLEDGASLNEPIEPESVSDMPTLTDLISKTEVLKSRQNTNTSQFSKSGVSNNNPSAPFDSSRYEDLLHDQEPDDQRETTMLSSGSPSKKPSSVGHVGQEKVWHTLRNGFDSRNTTSATSGKSVNFRSTHTEIPDIAEDTEPDHVGDVNKEEENLPYPSDDLQLPKSDSKVIRPIENPLRPLSKEQTEEKQLLEEEERYQKQLQMQIEDATHEAENIHIPKLDLDELSGREKIVSDDDDQREKKHTEMGLLDSLASTDRTVQGEPTLRDSLEQPSGIWEKKYLELEQRLGQLEKGKDVPPPQLQLHSDQPSSGSARRMTSNDLKNLQNPAVSRRFSREFDYVPEDQYAGMDDKRDSSYRGNLPINFADEPENEPEVESSGNGYPHDERIQEEDQYYEQPHRANGPPPPSQQALPPPPQQQYANEQYSNQYPAPGPDNYQPQPGPEHYQPEPHYQGYVAQSQHPQTYPEGQQYPYEEQYVSEQYDAQQHYANEQYANEQPPGPNGGANGFFLNKNPPLFKGYREVDDASPELPSKDYITLNKKAIRGEVSSAKTYGKQFVQKKEYSERPPPAPPIRKNKPVATPAADTGGPLVHTQPRLTNTSGNNQPSNRLPPTPEETPDDENLSAEQRWAKRAQVLAVKKDKTTGSKPESKASLRKFPSTSKVDDLNKPKGRQGTYNVGLPQSLQGSATVHRHTAQGVFNPASPPKQAFHERNGGIPTGRTYTVDGQRMAENGQHPVTHSLVTGDGQKLDVDINVKVLNPSHPNGGGVVPGISGSRAVSHQGRPLVQHPQSQPLPQSQYGHESPLQIQSVNSSAGAVRHPHLIGPQQAVVLPPSGYSQPHVQPPPPQHAPYNGPGYHYESSQPHHYHYSPPDHVQNGHGDHHPRIPLAHQTEDPRFGGGPRQPLHPSVFGPAAGRLQLPQQARGPTHNKHSQGSMVQPGVPTQPMQAFQPFQESFEHYNHDQTLYKADQHGFSDANQHFEASGATSPSSFRGGYGNTPTPGNMSPYKVVPPIGAADEYPNKKQPFTQHSTTSKHKPTPRGYHDDVEMYGGSDRSGVSAGGGGSYMDAFEKNKSKKRVSTYKPYTINDYRKMKKEVRLGGLGPDVDRDTVKEKKEKLQRQLNYAKSINERNREEYEQEKTRPRPETYTKDEEEEEDDVIDKRRLALEYAKSVPKPKVRPQDDQEPDSSPVSANLSRPRFKFVAGNQTNSMKTVTTLRAYPAKSEQNRGGLSTASDRQNSAPLTVTTNQDTDSALIDLDALQQRHQQEREKVAMIRQNMQVS